MSSILYRHQTELPLLELCHTWARELPETSRNELMAALIQAGWDGLYDDVGAGRPGLYRDREGSLEPLHSEMLRAEVAGPRHRLVLPKRLAENIVVSKTAVFAFCAASGVALPSWWKPEDAPSSAVDKVPKSVAGRKTKYNWEAAAIAVFGKVYRGEVSPPPANQAEVMRLLENWFFEQEGEAPGDTALKEHARPLFREID